MRIAVRTCKLSKYYGRGSIIKAVDELDLEVYEGETFGLLGPNGAGKTTTVRLLSCIIKPTGGIAIVNGYDILKEENRAPALGAIYRSIVRPFVTNHNHVHSRDYASFPWENKTEQNRIELDQTREEVGLVEGMEMCAGWAS